MLAGKLSHAGASRLVNPKLGHYVVMARPKGLKQTAETKLKISRTKTGQARTPEARQAISVGQKRAWARRKAEKEKLKDQ